MTKKQAKSPAHKKNNLKGEHQTVLPTFMDHVRELQGRLFVVAFVFVASAGIAYPFFDHIAKIILAPLSDDQKLVYLTPGGAFSFMIQVCLYVGLIATVPMIIYQVYRFIMPAVREFSMRKALAFTVASLILAIIGVVFAYIVSLPAALYFLTNFNLYHIDPMLTIDSYFSFVMTYLVAGAILFQLPLLMIIIDSLTPQTPKKLLGYQRHIIVGSFVVAAVISPTPDMLNQTLLASPLIIMYQLGIILIWLTGRRRRKEAARRVRANRPSTPKVTVDYAGLPPSTIISHAATQSVAAPALGQTSTTSIRTHRPAAPSSMRLSMDGVRSVRRAHVVVPTRVAPDATNGNGRLTNRAPRGHQRSVDGFALVDNALREEKHLRFGAA